MEMSYLNKNEAMSMFFIKLLFQRDTDNCLKECMKVCMKKNVYLIK